MDLSRPIALSIPQAVAASGGTISRTRIFALIANNDIKSRRVGRRRLIDYEDFKRFLTTASVNDLPTTTK
jgi:excisionase family DNA binding protein